ncbi:unnamed protein product [Candidula unifasciata]|uniref:Uncharacterized protein n=1 Tax=Candidula unifasciata TaxID=100452 RepID=A0A8S3ZTS5_9EUPU|nr:unnamed protein product [Candidula unifasciata]
MSTTLGSSLRLRNGQNANTNTTDFTHSSNNVIPPLPKKTLPNHVLSKKSANRTSVREENEQRPCSTAMVDSLHRDAGREQVGTESFQMTAMKVFCTKVPNYGYLTPADAPVNNESHARSTVTRNSPVTNRITRRSDSEPRNVDLSTSIPVSPTSVLSVSRLSTEYDLPDEDMDHYNRIHDDQWHPSNGQQGQSQIPGVPDDSAHTYLQFSSKSSSNTIQQCTSLSRVNCWIVVSLTATLIISMTALSLSIYELASVSANTRHISLNLTKSLGEMSITVNDLIQENEVFKGALESQKTNVTLLTEDKMNHAWTQFENLKLVIESFSDKFDDRIANLSLTPGPQGDPGTVNYSLCVNESVSASAPASATVRTETSLLPSMTDIQNYFVTFAYCTYSGATDVNLDSLKDNTTQRQRYRCKCWGQVSGVNQTVCSVFVWMCPQEWV